MPIEEAPQSTLGPSLVPDSDPGRPMPLPWQTYVDRVLARWHDLLASDPEESEVQEFLQLHPAMIPGGSGDVGPGGHHGSELNAVFRTPRLKGQGRDFEPDFMWVTRSSGLITPILIEIEKPSKRWFKADGRPTQDFAEAHDQLNDWRSWFARDQNAAIFRDAFLFNSKYPNRPIQPHFVLIYGRQAEFEHGGGHQHPDSVRYKRDSQRLPDEAFMTFDSVRPRYDHSSSLTVTMTAQGPRPFAVSPAFGTDTGTVFDALILGPIDDALGRSEMLSPERREYLAERWKHWTEIARHSKDERYICHTGRE